MRSFFLAAILLCIFSRLCAQLPVLYLKPKQAQALGVLSKTATLIVVIENEKNADDAALISAVKEQWKIGPVKYMSGLEFYEKFKSGTLDAANLYLFNNYTRGLSPASAGVTYNPTKLMNAPAFRRGYYLTNAPLLLIASTKYEKAPPFLYFSADALYDQKEVPAPGFYALMIKNFNHDINYCRDDANFKSKKKAKRKNGIYFFAPDSIAGKTLLLVKEQTHKREKKKDGDKPGNSSLKRQPLVTDNYTNTKEPYIVFPEDIDYAVKKSDGNILLYNGGCLYSALDGSVYATSLGKQSGSGTGIITIASLVITAAAFAVFIINTH